MSRLSDNSVILPYKERCKYHVSLMTIHYPMISMIRSIKGHPLPIACWIWPLNEAVFGTGLQIQRSCAPIALIGWRHFQIYNIIRAKQMHTCGPTLWWHWWRIHMNEINSRRRNFNNVQLTCPLLIVRVFFQMPLAASWCHFLVDTLGHGLQAQMWLCTRLCGWNNSFSQEKSCEFHQKHVYKQRSFRCIYRTCSSTVKKIHPKTRFL